MVDTKQSDKYRTLVLWVLAKVLPQSNIGFLCNMAGKLLKLGDCHPFTCKFEQLPINIFLLHLCFLTSHPSLHQSPFHLAIPFPLRFGNLQVIGIIIFGFHLAIRIDSAGPTIASRFRRSAWRHWVRGIHIHFVLVVRHCQSTKHKTQNWFESNLRKRCNLQVSRPADRPTERFRNSLVPWQCRGVSKSV